MIDQYKHLNQEDKFVIDLEDIAKQAVEMNYGVHRLLSAIVRNIRKHRKHTEMADSIEKLLED